MDISLTELIRAYLSIVPQREYLFVNSTSGRRYSAEWARKRMGHLLQDCGIDFERVRKYERGPCLHCFRHTFVAKALVSCSSNSTPANMQDVLKGKQLFYYATNDGSDFASVNIADIPSLFNPDDAYMAIQNYAMIDLDGDGSEEAVVFVCGVTGDTGGYLVLHSSDDHVYGYRTDYRTFENLKTDGTFIYSDDLGSKEGVATIGFTQDGLVITDVLSATGQAYTMDNFMISGKKATQEEYNAEKENQDLKNNVEWHEYPIS